MKYASIDVGTNTALMLIAGTAEDKIIDILAISSITTCKVLFF
jgi:exopolyphosphatase/pppGpp-phosphohydrolase